MTRGPKARFPLGSRAFGLSAAGRENLPEALNLHDLAVVGVGVRSDGMRGGDVGASERADAEFTAFVEGAQPRLSRVAVLLTGNRATAEDLVQEAFIRTYLNWSKVRPEGAYSYTRRILVNLNTDRWRRRHLEPVLGDLGDDRVSDSASRGYATVDHRDDILHELAGLSARERSVVVLRHYLDLSERQVAEELDISVGTVKSTCSRALARLGSQRVGEGRLS